MPRKDAGFKAALAAFSPHALGVAALTLSFILFKVGVAFYRLRGAPIEVALFNLLGFSTGMLAAALSIHVWERQAASGSPWRNGALALFLLLPGLFSGFLYFVTRFAVQPVADTVQAGLWGMPLSTALYLFFRHVHPRTQALWFGFAVGLGSLFWAIGIPFIGEGSVSGFSATDKERMLMFLLLLRSGVLALMALAAFTLMRRTSPFARSADRAGGRDGQNGSLTAKEASGQTAGQTTVKPARQPARQAESRPGLLLLQVLAPTVLLYLLNGYQTAALKQPIAAVERHGELLNLLLVFLFFFLGFAITHRKALLPNWYTFTVCCMALLAALRLFPDHVPATAINLVAEAAEQLLLFCAALSLGRLAFGAPFRFPALICCSGYLAFLAMLPGRLAGMGIKALLPGALAPVLMGAAFLCVASVFLLRRAYPLPLPAPAAPAMEGAASNDDSAAAKRIAFAAAFGLTGREVELLDALLEGLEREEVAERLGISERTVRFHLGGVLKKTSLPNSKRLLLFYASWQATS